MSDYAAQMIAAAISKVAQAVENLAKAQKEMADNIKFKNFH